MQQPATTRRPPRKPRKIRWKYGLESDFKLLVFDGDGWRPPFYSHDVPNKAISKGGSREFNDTKKIERLQQLFAKGGTRGNPFSPAGVSFALILPNFGKISEAVARWTPQTGWHKPAPLQPQQRTAEAIWRLWLAGKDCPSKTFVARLESDEFRQYASGFSENRAHLVSRFADPESGELPDSVIVAAYLGEVAARLGAGKKYSRGYIYYGQRTEPVLRIDLKSGRLCGIGQGDGWVSPYFFFTL